MRELKKASVLPDRIDGEKCWELTRNEMYGLGELEESYTEYEDDPTGDGDSTPEEQWKLWDFCARYDEQIERMKRAKTVTGDKMEQYRTTLRHCDCPDFEKNRRPCKHMYSLAMSLGIQARPEQEEPRRRKREKQ